MKFVDDFRDKRLVSRLSAGIKNLVTRPWKIMEVCGGQTHAIVRYGLDQLLPAAIELVHGPGCPVCVTPMGVIDQAVELTLEHRVILCSYGDMLRVPGSGISLMEARARGADVRVVYSPLDAVALARRTPDRRVVFLAVGFETTAPAHAMAAQLARSEQLMNFSLLVAHVLVPPAIAAIMDDPLSRVQGFLAAGHVCTVMGTEQYEPLATRYKVPIVVTGFEPVDVLQGLYLCIKQLEEGRAEVENQYERSVRQTGNHAAQALVAKVFEVTTQMWRGIGAIPMSGLSLQSEYRPWDASAQFGLAAFTDAPVHGCISGEILRGLKKPFECGAFGRTCTPERPLGAPMVSSEGACAAYFQHRLHAPAALTAEVPS